MNLDDYILSIDIEKLIEADKKTLSLTERKQKAQRAFGFYKNNFDKELELMMYQQVMQKLGLGGVTPEEIIFGRGVLRGLQIIDEWFKAQENIHKAKPQEQEKSELGLPEVG